MNKPAPLSAYWTLVSACLVEFYGYSQKTADKSVAQLRQRLKNAGVKTRSANDMIYHSEAIDIAAELARERHSVAEFDHKRYEKLKSRVLHLTAQQVVAVRPAKTVHLPAGYVRIDKFFEAKKAESTFDFEKLRKEQPLLSK